MKPFGPTFRVLRENKGYKLKEISQGIITIPTLSNFETGQSDIKLMNFIPLLNRINCTFDEFIYAYASDAIVDINKLMIEFVEANNKNYDKYKLLKLSDNFIMKYDRYHHEAYLHMSIVCEIYSVNAQRVDEKKRAILHDYLSSVEIWGRYEFFLFHCISQIFSKEELKQVRPFFLRSVEQFAYFPEINVHEIILNQALVCILQQDIDECETLMKAFYEKPISDFTQVGYLLFGQFIDGLILITKGEDTGVDKCNQLISQLAQFDQFLQVRNQLSYWIERATDFANHI